MTQASTGHWGDSFPRNPWAPVTSRDLFSHTTSWKGQTPEEGGPLEVSFSWLNVGTPPQ